MYISNKLEDCKGIWYMLKNKQVQGFHLQVNFMIDERGKLSKLVVLDTELLNLSHYERERMNLGSEERSVCWEDIENR